MHSRYVLLLAVIYLLGCSKNSEEPESTTTKSLLISSYYLSDENGIDSVFYEGSKPKMLKEYVGGTQNTLPSLDYTTNFNYNSKSELVEITKVQSKETIPSITINYEYNTDGSLKTKTRQSFFGTSRIQYSYEQNTILIGNETEVQTRINLNSKNQISNVETYGGPQTGFYVFKEYYYNDNNQINRILYRTRGGEIEQEFRLIHDEKQNPFQVFDFILPNMLSLRMLEDAQDYSGYVSLPDSFSIDDDNWGYFNKTNMTSCTTNQIEYDYIYEYHENGLPSLVRYSFRPDTSLIINYYDN